MDFQSFVNTVAMPCCVMSVEKTPEGTCGQIRIICANQVYREIMGPNYYDNMPYDELVPQDNKFEDYCFRAAVLKQRMHAYVETTALNCWTDQTLIPLASDREDLGYCQFIFEFTKKAEADRRADISMEAAEKVIEACIRLMGSDDFQKSTGDALDVILEASGAGSCRIMLVDHDRRRATTYCERHSDTLRPVRKPGEEVISYELIVSWERMIGVSNAVIIKDEQDMRLIEAENPEWAGSMRENDVTSLVLIPLRPGRAVIGYLYVVNFDVSKVVEVKEMIELMAFFLGAEIANGLLVEKLERLSSIDVLTGLNNRRAMISRMKELEQGQGGALQPYGVVNIDLNGLKVVNDNDGHDSGDLLLKQAGELLQKVFYYDDLFRTGGDEFIVITSGISRETFDRKIARLRSDVAKNSEVSFAIGAFWSDGNEDFKTAFHCADIMMYEDKEKYYRENPQVRRR